MSQDASTFSRREFLAATAVLAGSSTLRTTFGADEVVQKSVPFAAVKIPAWVRSVTRMAFVTPGEIDRAAALGVQVCHGNAVWPYYPLRRDGGGLSPADRKLMQEIVDRCHQQGMKYCLGL